MSLVRREGNWRLRRRAVGWYEISYHGEPREWLLTPAYGTDSTRDIRATGVDVRRVESRGDATDRFEVHIGRDWRVDGVTERSPEHRTGGWGAGADRARLDAIESVPPGGLGLGLLVFGVVALVSARPAVGSAGFLLAGTALLVGIGILGWVATAAADGSATLVWPPVEADGEPTDPIGQAASPSSPDVPSALERELLVCRADGRCEWCGVASDELTIHHIVSHREGGATEPSNLAVLCQHHRRLAAAGDISASALAATLLAHDSDADER